MNLRTVRWQLPLSYAGIALLAALALGTVLLAVLRDYYTQRERDYLLYTAKTMQVSLIPMLSFELPPPIVQAQVDSLAVFSQTRVQILGPAGQVRFDSGLPASRDVLAFSPLPAPFQKFTIIQKNEGPAAEETGVQKNQIYRQAFGLDSSDDGITVTLRGEPAAPAFKGIIVYQSASISSTQTLTSTEQFSASVQTRPGYGMLTSIPVAASIQNGFALGNELENTGERSSLSVDMPLKGAGGEPLGTIHLSDGPAYGRSIVKRVAESWAIAGGLAVLVAAAAGWLASRRVTEPLSALNAVTVQMASGNLAARAAADTQDEFGLLGNSFNEMAGRIEDTVSTLRRFVSDAAHELQTPLTALRTNLELATNERPTAEQSDHVERALEEVIRLSRLTEGLLDLSRLESNRGSEGFIPVDLAALSAEVSEPYAAQAEQAGQTLALSLPSQPVLIQGNALQLQRAVSNLLDNALKFTPPGGTITVGLEADEDEARLWVQDTGIGIPEEDFDLLFSRFHRGRNAAAYPGSGLGLAIVRAILQAHRGRVWAEAAPWGGSRFTIEVPREPLRR